MAALRNAKHERFAQGLAKGLSASEAYEEAGFKPNRGNASVLKQNQSIIDRVAEILERRETTERKALERAIEKLAITKERVLSELAKIGFSDIRKVVKWRGSLVREQDNPNGGEVLVIKEIVTNHVQIVDSDDIDDDTAGAIAEISQSATGGLKVKMYDKKAALVDLGKHLGMFKDKVEVTGANGGPIETEAKPNRELAKLILGLLAKSQAPE